MICQQVSRIERKTDLRARNTQPTNVLEVYANDSTGLCPRVGCLASSNRIFGDLAE
jgi:hypothetical protein